MSGDHSVGPCRRPIGSSRVAIGRTGVPVVANQPPIRRGLCPTPVCCLAHRCGGARAGIGHRGVAITLVGRLVALVRCPVAVRRRRIEFIRCGVPPGTVIIAVRTLGVALVGHVVALVGYVIASVGHVVSRSGVGVSILGDAVPTIGGRIAQLTVRTSSAPAPRRFRAGAIGPTSRRIAQDATPIWFAETKIQPEVLKPDKLPRLTQYTIACIVGPRFERRMRLSCG
jgi:hypothetical protein